MADIYESLVEIVGKGYVSNEAEERYLYGRDPGLMPPHEPDYIVMPNTAEQVQKIVVLANRRKIPVVPKGAGLSLTGLVIPLRGGILLDMKRLDRILEVNEKARYAVVEGGTTQAALKSHLDKNYPQLRHSVPDAPPIATLAANAVIHGQGRLTQQYGFNSDMITGLEVVLPTGEIVRVGSNCLGPYWFSKGAPLPDLSGLFLGWLGTTGIITKIGIRLYPKKRIRDVDIFVTDRADLVPDIVRRLTHTEMFEDINVWTQPVPAMFRGNHHVTMYLTADSEQELAFKRRMAWEAVQCFIDSKDGGFMWVQPDMKPTLMESPQKSICRFADVRRGGGFEYSGPIIQIDAYSECIRELEHLAAKYNLSYSATSRIIGRGHCMMFSFAFTFNRADKDEMARARKALDEATLFALELGGVPWKPTIDEQRMIIERMDPNTRALMKKIKELLDPNGIMNPGNWEVQ